MRSAGYRLRTGIGWRPAAKMRVGDRGYRSAGNLRVSPRQPEFAAIDDAQVDLVCLLDGYVCSICRLVMTGES